MTGTVAILTVGIDERERLIRIFGPEAAGLGLTDFGDGLDRLMDRLLAQHEVIGRSRHDADGRWSARFRVLAGGLPRDAGETCAAIEEAGRKLVHDLLVAVFGMGTGMRIPFVLAVLPLPDRGVPAGEECPAAWIEEVLAARPRRTQGASDGARAAVAGILATRTLRTVLQPIVRMADRRVVGFEALSRGPEGSPLERPDLLFDAAHTAGLSVETELLCAELALERTRDVLPPGALLTINLGPEALARAADALPLAGRRDILFELTEHLPLGGAEDLAAPVAQLRTGGVGLALDDTGCGFADMETARILRPDIVKLCITVVRNADKGSPFVDAIGETTRRLRAMDCRVLAEGVETEDQHAALSGCGIELAQGWLYGRPASLADSLKAGGGIQTD